MEMVPFQKCVFDCGLADVKYNGSYFTWNNKQARKDRVFAKLDPVLASHGWLDKFPTTEVTFLPKGVFDHTPAILSIYPNFHDTKKPLRYFNYWSSLKNFSGIVQNGWQENLEGLPMYKLVSKLELLKRGLKSLNQQGDGDISIKDSEDFKTLLAIQVALREQPGNGELIAQEIQARNHYADM
ncbi:uncharacterized protein LOC133825625 [Humulus lupulus]|uniref:uncharacterized protein LOC133825625 n=1 Tax=Humulus lupulus TaxID=3486 RepID=UPI002B400AE2|nr:uncharacterized protein LOC133825625 [Humulus lupulus]